MFELEKYIITMRDITDRALDAALPKPGSRPVRLVEALRYAVFSGGKRIRPVLCMASAEASGGTVESAIAPATAIEMLHAYTLVHDDLPAMDNDDERRGRPTTHIVFGEANAILAGDALQALAFQTVASSPLPADCRVRLLQELSDAAGWHGVVGGQWVDIDETGSVDLEAVEYVHRHKTAALFIASVRMGAIAAGAGKNTLAQLTAFAEALGCAFQIIDDLLDTEKNSEEGELSCLSVMSEGQAREKASELTGEAINALELIKGDTTALYALAGKMLHRDS